MLKIVAATKRSPGASLDRFLEALNACDGTLSDMLRRHSQDQSVPYESFAQGVHRVLRAESCAIFLVRRQGDDQFLELVSQDGDSDSTRLPARMPIKSKKGHGLTPHLASSNRIVRLHGKALQANSYRTSVPPLHLKGRVVHSLLSFPLKNRKGQLLGLVEVVNKKGVHGQSTRYEHFSDADVSLAAFLSNRLVVALEGREFMNFVKTLLHDKSDLQDLKSFESRILNQVLNLVGADRGALALWDHAERALVFSSEIRGGLGGNRAKVPKTSIMYSVWMEQRSIYVPDVRKHSGPYFMPEPDVRSEVAVLVAATDKSSQVRPIGVLIASSFTVGGFDIQDQAMLEAVADTLAGAIDAAQPELSLRQALASLSAPARVFAEPGRLLVSILERVRETYGFNRGMIYVAEEMGGRLRLGAQMGLAEQSELVGKYTLEMSGGSLAALVWRTAEPVFREKPQRDRSLADDSLDLYKIDGPVLGLPLIHSGKTLGVLICWSCDGPPPRPEHQRDLAPFAQVAAAEIAISHAYGLLDEWIHNIASPAQNVLGLTRLIELQGDHTQSKGKILATLESEAEHLLSIVQRSRLLREHQRVPSQRKSFCLTQVVEATARAFSQQANEQGVKVELALPPGRECPIFGDENRIAIGLGELVSNAVAHSPPGGVILLELKTVGAGYEVSVTDEGEGIPESYAQRIFDPYFSLRRAGGQAGTGLGLTIAHGIVEEHGGTLRYSPRTTGRGAVFTEFLPRAAS